MESYGVILANEPRLLRELLLRALHKARDIKVAGEVKELKSLGQKLEQTDARWVIVSLWQDGQLPEILQHLLTQYPSLCLLGVAMDGSQIKIRCPGLVEITWHGLSLNELLTTLRSHEPQKIVLSYP